MKSTTTLPRHSCRKAAKDAQAAPAQSPLPSWRCSPSKQDEQGGKAVLTPAFLSITFAAINAANVAAVATTNPCRNPVPPSTPAANAEAPVHTTLPAGVATFPAADIMPTVALAPTAKFATSEAAAADVTVATAGAYSMLCVTIADDAKNLVVQASAPAVASAVIPTVALAVTANFATAEAAAADVSVATVAAYSTSTVAVASAAAVASVVAVAVQAVASIGKKG
jgi:hypothetical protein